MLRRIMQVGMLITAVAGLGVVGAGCLDRPLVTAEPTLKTNFTTKQTTNNISKVDLLFDIDNSASMGDKQEYLEQAVPDLIGRLVNPNCIMTAAPTAPGVPPVITVVGTSMNGACATGTIEFPPVHDMHIGIISSSLGNRGITNGGEVCASTNAVMFADNMMLPNHDDDQAHLLNRTAVVPTVVPGTAEDEGTSADVGAENFLDWFPTQQPSGYDNVVGTTAVPATPTNGICPTCTPPGPVLTPAATPLTMLGGLGTAGTLEGDFAALVAGTHAYGCGIESQLETWYRFLIQPDPYASISSVNNLGVWNGIDTTILNQRHDFLRPDSLVAIIVLTDENDSEIDVRSFGGQGVNFMDEGPPYGNFTPPRGTSACAIVAPTGKNPLIATSCTSCAYPGVTDPNCKMGNYTAENDPGFYINVRHVHMVPKYGITAQFPLQRYVLGLTSNFVPDRSHEYPAGASSYQGGTVVNAATGAVEDPSDLDCANPLFAATLPTVAPGVTPTPEEVCNKAAAGTATRSANIVFYAHIGGVPHQLLQLTPGETDPDGTTCLAGTPQADCPQKDTLQPADWMKILGEGFGATSGTNAYDYTGIDPHMVEDFEPRTYAGLTAPASYAAIPAPGAAPAPDPINGWEWQTNSELPNSTNPFHVLPVDREYACIFPLQTPRDCSGGSADPVNSYACDCESLGLPAAAVPAVCGLRTPAAAYVAGAPAGPITTAAAVASATTANDYTTQYFAKTYPTIRELALANLMGPQGVISSLCPIHVMQVGGADDPLYGYRPAVNAIINRLKNALAAQCLPQPLQVTGTGANAQVPCLILATLPNTPASQQASACDVAGLTQPPAQVLQAFNEQQQADYDAGTSGTNLALKATCQVFQNPANVQCSGNGSMGNPGKPGWCYVTGTLAGTCDTQAIQFSANTPPNGSIVNLQCILENADAGGD
jgi:hypothetical protein